MNKEEPVTPVGRLFLQEEGNQVINCITNAKYRINIESVKAEIKNSILIQHPRFQSVLVKNKNGREYWKRGDVNLDKHIFVIQDIDHGDSPSGILSDDEIVNEYLADLTVSSPLNIDKPLWEIHILKDQNCIVLRINHALGDGVSLMSLILAMCRKVDQPDQLPSIRKNSTKSSSSSSSMREMIWRLVMKIWLTIVYGTGFLLRSLCLKDAKSKISCGHGVQLWPRKLATARFKLDDMKSVKNAVLNATINDVLFGVIASGLSRYLDYHRTSDSKPKEGLQITGIAMVNLREQPGLQEMSSLVKSSSVTSWWGNKFAFLLLPIYPHKNVGNDALQYVKNAKEMLDKKKLSLEAHFTYAISKLAMSLLGPKVTYFLNNKVFCNTSFTTSNVVGPQEEIMFGGNPITSFRATSSSLPHALTMHMVSYAGKAEMQILVAKDIIPDPQFLAKCFEDALLEMKEASVKI
ncbi:O-acyltransferase WSD1-like [Papaver somniferum]|uniref:O-acyltransferase WSD1-like n=1 Tax=Papaver somniferum TaxID=3469 RepID=UPI000E700FFA|nr:O-acyltransferase WSD1-like [Papaver somniferum]